MRHGILLLYEMLNRTGAEWTLGPLALAHALDISYEPLTDIAIYHEDIARIDINELIRWGITRIFRTAEPGFSNRAIHVRGLPCISPRDIMASIHLNPGYPLMMRILEKTSSLKETLDPAR
ncbi:MAG: hypothetical protein GXO23_06000 [Crenarchaeota archaeon]|nr:hypothetical protein [Thermoproteota archaeon]